MSLCRWSTAGRHGARADSDLYLFWNTDGFFECCACPLDRDGRSVLLPEDDTAACIAHVREHIAAGHAVPEHVIPYLEDGVRT